MDPIMSLAELAKDFTKQAAWVFAIVELVKDLHPTISPGVTKLTSYSVGIVIAAAVSWTPGLPWSDYLATALFNGVAVGMMSIGLHETARRAAHRVSGGGA
jgi:hypothetical protein